jgi:hypothetical protein
MSVYRILSLDGGGILGVLTAAILERLEQSRPGFLQMFDLFAGTSTLPDLTGSLLQQQPDLAGSDRSGWSRPDPFAERPGCAAGPGRCQGLVEQYFRRQRKSAAQDDLRNDLREFCVIKKILSRFGDAHAVFQSMVLVCLISLTGISLRA